MPIRKEDDALSRAQLAEDKYFGHRDENQFGENFNRFFYMKPGTKQGFYDWRLDWKKHNISMKMFFIDEHRYVNRPDAISAAVYGNSKYWWLLAMVNDFKNPFEDFSLGKKIRVPDLQEVKTALGI